MIFKIITCIFASIGIIIFLILYPIIGYIYLVKFYGICGDGYLWGYILTSFILYCTHLMVFRILKYKIEDKTLTSYFLCFLNIILIIWGIQELYFNKSCKDTEFWAFGIFNLILQFIMALVFFLISLYNTCIACIHDNACMEAQIQNNYEYGSVNEV